MVTRDVNVVIALNEKNLVQLWHALDGVNPHYRGVSRSLRRFTEEDARRSDWKNIYLKTDLGPLDCLGVVKGIGDYEACVSRIIEQDFDGRLLRILDRDTLIEAKLAVGRPQDLLAVNQLRLLGSQDNDC